MACHMGRQVFIVKMWLCFLSSVIFALKMIFWKVISVLTHAHTNRNERDWVYINYMCMRVCFVCIFRVVVNFWMRTISTSKNGDQHHSKDKAVKLLLFNGFIFILSTFENAFIFPFFYPEWLIPYETYCYFKRKKIKLIRKRFQSMAANPY